MPLLAVDLTDTVLESLLDIIIHIPLPEADPSLKVPTDPDALLKYFPTAAANNQFSAMQVMRTANALDSEESTWYNSEESIDSESSIASSKVRFVTSFASFAKCVFGLYTLTPVRVCVRRSMKS
ncbi:unnamed protein product [Dibothriocephalus latus]|uniref:Uncharacterized protein n=1 Tax=Dibothriocephalus latus TaxID=60516 RepID=A0A3P7Q4N5_DIBLA|nr:unnamed protein product [Dibothriocephalus latus]